MLSGFSTFSFQFETAEPQEQIKCLFHMKALGLFERSSQIPLESSVLQIQYPQFL